MWILKLPPILTSGSFYFFGKSFVTKIIHWTSKITCCLAHWHPVIYCCEGGFPTSIRGPLPLFTPVFSSEHRRGKHSYKVRKHRPRGQATVAATGGNVADSCGDVLSLSFFLVEERHRDFLDGWFQMFFSFTSIWGRFFNLTNIFQMVLKPPTKFFFGSPVWMLFFFSAEWVICFLFMYASFL